MGRETDPMRAGTQPPIRSLPARGRLLLSGALILLLGATPAPAITALQARNTSFKLQSEAMRLYKEGDYRKAIELLRQVTNLSLNSFLAYFYLGLSLSADRQYAEALDPLKIALELEPSHIQAHIALGDVYLKMGDLAEARAEYLRALNLQETYAPAHDGLGRLHEAEGDDDRAEEEYRKALEYNVAHPDAYANLGELYLRKGRLDDAIDLFQKAIQVKPDFSLAYSRLGIAFSREGLVHQAVASVSRAKALAPRDPLPYLALAEIYLDRSNLARAESEIEAGIARDAEGHEGPLLKSRLLLAREDPEGALGVLEGALEGDLREVAGRRALEKERDRIRELKERVDALAAAIAADPGRPEPYRELAGILAETGAVDRAVSLASRAQELAPDDGTRFRLGVYLLRAGRPDEALSMFEELAAGGSRSALLNLGVARAALGRDEAAADAYRRYLADHPRDPRAHLYLGNSLLRIGREEEARESYQAYLDLSSGDERTGKVRRLLRLLETGRAAR
jgi:tetratricopeptide (TPR) repeat protein